jgi:hypothetical protein
MGRYYGLGQGYNDVLLTVLRMGNLLQTYGRRGALGKTPWQAKEK